MSDAESDRVYPLDSGSPLDGTPPSPAPPPVAALREDQIQNAVAFLSHPKVRASAVSSKREFLQRKGLTEEEIGEAFRRVPEQPAGSVAAAAPAVLQPQATTYLAQNQQPQQQQAYGQQPGQPGALVLHQAPQPQPERGVRWTQAALGAGFLAAGGYAAKSLLWPYVSDAFYSLRGQVRPPPRPRSLNGSDAEGGEASAIPPAAAAAGAGAGEGPEATRAVAEAIQAQTAELRSSIDSIKQLVGTLEASSSSQKAAGPVDAGGGGDGGLTVSDLRQELRAFAQTLHEAPPAASTADAPAASAGGGLQVESELGEIKSLLAQILRSPLASRSRSPGNGEEAVTPLSVSSAPTRHLAAGGGQAAVAAPPGGGLAAAADEEQGQQQHLFATPGRMPPAASTAATAAADFGGDGVGGGGGGMSNGVGSVASGGGAPTPPPHPASYMEVLEMLEKGHTPPGIRTDINDKPPNPDAAPAESRLKPRPKPWERSSGGGGALGGSSSSLASLEMAGPQPVPAAATAGAATAGEQPAEPAAVGAQQALSPVQAPSPSEQEAAAGAVASPQQPVQASSGGSSFQSPRRAASIFEAGERAVAPPPDSPHIIAGRLSPGGVNTMGRINSSSYSSGGAPPPPPTAVSSSFSALLAAAEERASSREGSLPPPEGSGIGRPSSRNWKPPPIPAPTLTASTSAISGDAAAGSGGSASAPPAAPSGGSGLEAGAKVPSAASRGDDFASA